MRYPLYLIVNSLTIDNTIKYTINLLTRNIFYKDNTVYIGPFCCNEILKKKMTDFFFWGGGMLG